MQRSRHLLTTAWTTWLSAEMLAKDPIRAQTGAILFYETITKQHANKCSLYDLHFLNSPVLMEQLHDFATRAMPCLLWRSEAKYKDLFIFLSMRFLTSPDSVLDCESVHAQWKWLEHVKRNVSIRMLNALLKLNNYINYFGELPDYAELAPHIKDVKKSWIDAVQAVKTVD